jgi:spermidine synthase
VTEGRDAITVRPERSAAERREVEGRGAVRPIRLRLLWLAYGLSGAATLADEVVWTRWFQILLGSSVYAVSAMLSALMAGLALGGFVGGRIGDRLRDPARAFALCELGAGASALASAALLAVVPALHLWAFRRFQLSPGLYFAFDAIVCLPVVLLPTALMGMTFPLVARLAALAHPGRVAQAVGGVYAANTVGAIAGSALAGFVLVPLVGLNGTLAAAAFANAAAAALVLAATRGAARALAGVPLMLLAAGVGWAAPPPRPPIGYHLASRVLEDPSLAERLAETQVLFDRWAPEGHVEVLRDSADNRILVVDGRIEGSSRTRERVTQHLLALAPGALRGELQDVFAIGLGTGRTLVLLLDTYRSAAVELAEVNPAVAEAVRLHFRPDLGRHVSVGDGRLLLARRAGPYDAIVSAPSFPVDAASGGLFTREFYALARSRLRPAGVLVAWVPGYLLDARELRALVATAAQSFPHLALWRVTSNDDLVLVASGEPFANRELPARLAAIDEPLWVKTGVLEPVLDPSDVARYLADGPAPRLHRDADPWLELAMARNLVRGKSWLDR